MIWNVTPASGAASWPRAEVSYAHLDRFLLQATVGCGEHRAAASVPVPAAAVVPAPGTEFGLP